MTIPTAVGRQLFRHHWPANIRELEQALIRGLTLAAPGALDARHFLQGMTDRPPAAAATGPIPMPKPLDEADAKLRQELVALLQQHQGSVSDVARALGEGRTQVHRWLKRFEIDPNEFRSR
jgi:transcriptional regulator of acetoin/glycerol metabolism